VVYLDTQGIAVSTRSACGSGATRGSHVVRAMTGDDARAASTLRVTLGEETTESGIEACVEALKIWHVLMKKA
jgi:cysteine desulfurase